MEPETSTPEIDVPTALAALATEITKLDRRTVELRDKQRDTDTTMAVMTHAFERILGHHQAFCRIVAGLFAGLGVDPKSVELSELQRLFNVESPEDDPKQD